MDKSINQAFLKWRETGDTDAFLQLYFTFAPLCCKKAASLLRNADNVDDVLHRVFFRFLSMDQKTRNEIDDINHFEALARVYTKRFCFEIIRPQELFTLFDEDKHNGVALQKNDALEVQLEAERNKLLLEAITRLSKSHQRLIRWYFYEELTKKEISEHLRISEDSVSDRLYRAVNKLKEQVKRISSRKSFSEKLRPTIAQRNMDER